MKVLSGAGGRGLAVVLSVLGIGAAVAAPASATLTVVPPKTCGADQVIKGNDPLGIVKTLPAGAREAYNDWPWQIAKTPWKSFKGTKGPWKIGFISLPVDNPWGVDLGAYMQKEFAAAKAKGLVKGSLQTYIQPSDSTATPEQQIQAIQTMVREGVNGIIIHPLDVLAETPAIDAAGRAGVPVVTTADPAYTSKYALNIFGINTSPMIAGTLKLAVQHGLIGKGKTVNVLRIRGHEGATNETQFQVAGTNDMKACPGINVVGTVVGNWDTTTTKTAALQWFASHPGTKVNLVIQNGSMEAGIIEAFQQAGQPIPPMNFSGSTGGDFSWWAAHRKSYYSLGGQYTGGQTAVASFRVLLRTLAGDGPKLRDISLPAQVVTSQNVSKLSVAWPSGKSVASEPLSWVGDTGGSPSAWGSNAALNLLFVSKGTPGGL